MPSMGDCAISTRDQSASSSSDSSIAKEVITPWPISLLANMTVTVLSASMHTHPFNADCVADTGSAFEPTKR
jgi:hypothetical protein